MANRSLRTLKFKLAGAEIRTATFQDQEHLVVPVIALMEGVIQAVNAETPELVLAEELAKAPAGWNGRPVVADHPSENGQRISANDPKVLESEAFGLLFNTQFKDDKLTTEAWLDISKENNSKGVVERIRNGESIEVSVGVFVTAEQKSGTHDGKEYHAIWREIVPDHLAMLTEGIEGACSNEMGCGAPRAASCKEVRCMKDKKQSFRDRLKGLTRFRSGQEEDVSDVDLRHLLDEALRAVEPGFLWVEAVFKDTVVYTVEPEGVFKLFERGFSQKGAKVTLKDDPVEVEMVTRFEPVTAMKGETRMADEKLIARVQALIENPKSLFTSDDKDYLGGLTEERIASIETALVAESEPVKEPEGEPEPVKEPEGEPQAEKTEEELLAELPDEMQQVFQDHKAAQAKKKEDLVGGLKAAQKEFTECELKTMTIKELVRLSKVVKIATPNVDYEGLGAPRSAEDGEIPAAPSLSERFRTAAQK